MTARPTGVPLTADNVADAVECVDYLGVKWVRRGAFWMSRLDDFTRVESDAVMVGPPSGTVVTKWMKE